MTKDFVIINTMKKALLPPMTSADAFAMALPLLLGITSAPLLRAQADPNLRFEVASVRRVDIPATNGVPWFPPQGGIGTSDPTHISYHGAQPVPLIASALGINFGGQITLPRGIDSVKDRYDIVAKIPEGATKEQFNTMLLNLLRDRLHLRFHMETKVVPVYVLRIGKSGPKFKETAVGHDDSAKTSRRGLDAEGFPIVPPGVHMMLSMPHPGEVFTTAQDVTMAELAASLQRPGDRPVVDETGLTGHYDFKLHHDYGRGRGAADDGTPSPAPSVFTAVEEQLGLKLEPANRPLPRLIIDNIDREPTEN